MQIPFLKQPQPKDFLALDWGSSQIKLLKLNRQPSKGLNLQLLDTLDTPEEKESFVVALKEYVQKNNLLNLPCACAFQEEGLHIRRLELPTMPEEDLKEAVRWQFRDIAEGSLDNYVIRHTPLDKKMAADVSRVVLLGFAIKRETVQNKSRQLEGAGLKPFFIEPAPVSVAASLQRLYPSTFKEWIVGIDIGSKNTHFFVVGNDKLYFVRPLKECAIIHAQRLKEGYPPKLAVEIQHAIDAFSITYQVEKIQQIILTGGGASLPGVSEYLSKNLGIGTSLLDPLKEVQNRDKFPMAREKPYLFAAAMGLNLLSL